MGTLHIVKEERKNTMKLMKVKIIAILAVMLIAGTAYMLGTGVPFAPRTASAATVLYSQDTITAIYDNASPAVVEINVTQQGTAFRNRSMQEGQGSGFLIDNQGHILTNNHVVNGATNIQVILKDGNTLDARVVGTDPIDDLALISVDSSSVSGITPLQLGNSSAVKPGQMAIALGSPYGLTDSITVGVISGLDRSLGGSSNGSITGMLQTDAAINPGNSGGPLLDSQGQVIGINTAIESASGARGIGFAVSSNVATRVLLDLMAGNKITRSWLGIGGTALTQTEAKNLGLSVNKGVYVVTVIPNSPAEKAGLKGGGTDTSGAPHQGGDVITAVDGKSVTSSQNLSAYFNTKHVGDKVVLSVIRNSQSIDVQATLEAWPEKISVSANPQPAPQPNVPGSGGRRFRQAVPAPTH